MPTLIVDTMRGYLAPPSPPRDGDIAFATFATFARCFLLGVVRYIDTGHKALCPVSCDQDGLPVNLQGSDFNATIRISWDDPVPPQIGSAGAEAEDAYGMRDIKYVS